MSHNKIITENEKIKKFLVMIGLSFLLTVPQLKHICDFIAATTQKGFNGKITDIADLIGGTKHRTSIGRFLSSKSWRENLVLRALKKFVVTTIWTVSKVTGEPVYVIVDDTIAEKTKPSSKAKNPTEKCKYHQSHLENKKVYGHQIVIVLLECGKIRLPYSITLYEKEKQSKIEIAVTEISSLPKPPKGGYALADSWYSSASVINASNNAGFDYIGGIKVNRVIYPQKFRMNQQIKGFAKTLSKEDVHLVTVKKRSYYVYRYEGKINKIPEDVVILLTWPKSALFNEKALRAFVSTDTNLNELKILSHYVYRWPIEVFIRQCKMVLGLDKYQIRKEVAIKRFWILTTLAYVYTASQSVEEKYSFSEGLKRERISEQKSTAHWIFKQAINGVPFDKISQLLDVA